MILTLRFKFDSAHRLMHHDGQCKNIHGHTWAVEVVIEGAVKGESGMVADFHDLKLRFKEVIKNYDHVIILNKADTILSHDFSMKRILMEGEPTCENLAIKLFKGLAEVLLTSLGLRSVQVWESANASAMVTDAMMKGEYHG